jgi:hypothetical protein
MTTFYVHLYYDGYGVSYATTPKIRVKSNVSIATNGFGY